MFGAVNIAEINDCFGLHYSRQFTEIKGTKYFPFGYDYKGMSAICGIVDVSC